MTHRMLLYVRYCLIKWHGHLTEDVRRRRAGGDVDVQGLVKSTVARGEDEFPSGLLRVSDCHDSVVYALAPLQFASIYCCSDCTVVRPSLRRRSTLPVVSA